MNRLRLHELVKEMEQGAEIASDCENFAAEASYRAAAAIIQAMQIVAESDQ